MSYSSTAARTAANRCVWFVFDLHIETSLGFREIRAGRGEISEDFPVKCSCVLNGTGKHFLEDFPAVFVFSIIYLEVGAGVAISLGLTLFRF